MKPERFIHFHFPYEIARTAFECSLISTPYRRSRSLLRRIWELRSVHVFLASTFQCGAFGLSSARNIAKFAIVDSFLFPTSSSSSSSHFYLYFSVGRLVAVVRMKYQRLLITSALTYVIAKWLQSSRAQLHLGALAFRTCGMKHELVSECAAATWLRGS